MASATAERLSLGVKSYPNLYKKVSKYWLKVVF
jgi:hypothetical protein